MTDLSKKETALIVKQKKKFEDALIKVKNMLAEKGIDINEIVEKLDEKLFPTLPKELRQDVKTILIQTRGVFAFSSIGKAHQDDIPEFEEFMCDDCDEMLGPEHAYWMALGNMEYLRVMCPNCKTKVVPLAMPLSRTERINMNDPAIKKAAELAGLKKAEEIVDIEE